MICRSNMIPFCNGGYHKGLLIDGRLSVDFERELDKVTFGKCEIFPCDVDLPCPYEDSGAQIFLHGSCDLFAKQLREKFNYDIYEMLLTAEVFHLGFPPGDKMPSSVSCWAMPL